MVPIKYPQNTSKSKRIAGSAWRFDTGRIKFPAHLKMKWPFSALYNQVQDFTEDLALLQFDDACEVVLGMPQYVVHARGAKGFQEVKDTTLADRIRQGKSLYPGFPVGAGINPQDLKPDEIDAIEQLAYGKQAKEAERSKGFFIRPRVSG